MATRPDFDELFERRITYPDFEIRERLASLVGLDSHKRRLQKILGLLVNPAKLKSWIDSYHPDAVGVLNPVLRRPPLVVLAGDVGCGKTELAETIGDAVAREEDVNLILFPMSLSTRGQGRVGEMTQLLSAAFDYTIEEANKYKVNTGKSRSAVILLVDEADALAQTREAVLRCTMRIGLALTPSSGAWTVLAMASCRPQSSCARTGSMPSTLPCDAARQIF